MPKQGKPVDRRSNRSNEAKDPKKDFKGKEVKYGSSKYGFNDPSWYAKNPQLMKDAASLAFANFQGMIIHDTGLGGLEDFAPASICAVDYMPTFGKATSATDAINIAVRNIYSWVRHANSGHTNYESADLGMYLFGTSSCYAGIAFLEHLYGISRVYSVKNRALPKQLLSALGMYADEILENQAELRFQINRLIEKMASLCIPKGMSLLERWIWMNSFTFKDADTDKASLYVFRPIGYYKYEATTLPSGGCLSFNFWGPNDDRVVGAQNIIKTIESTIDAILEDEDMNIMSGDILKAYGEAGLVKLGYLPEDYISIPVYQSEVLPQIHNLVLPGIFEEGTGSNKVRYRSVHLTHGGTPIDYSAITSGIVLQQSGGILHNDLYLGIPPTSPQSVGYIINGTVKDMPFHLMPSGRVLLDLPTDSATPEEVMVATRLHPTFTFETVVDGGNSYEVVRLNQYGTELPVRLRIWNSGNTSPDFVIERSVVSDYIGGGVLKSDNVVMVGISLPQFDMYPITYYTEKYNLSPGSNAFYLQNFSFKYVMNDLYNFTTIEDSTLYKLHTTAVLSEMSTGTLFADK